MIYWAQLLHFYQPPTQIPEVLRKICDESYRPLINVFKKYPHARVTVNINGVLTEMLYQCGHSDIIDGLNELADRGQIEFTGSGKYHPIFRGQMRRGHKGGGFNPCNLWNGICNGFPLAKEKNKKNFYCKRGFHVHSVSASTGVESR